MSRSLKPNSPPQKAPSELGFTPAQRMAFESLHIPYVCLEPAELEIYDAILRELRPELCLEWGAGWSTIYFPSRHPCIEKWIAIEHNPAWYHRLKDRVPANVDLRLFAEQDDGYIFDIFNDELRFDFINVDGVRRGECMLAASLLLQPVTGRCLLHDTAREEYHRWFKAFDHAEKLVEGLLAGQNPHGQAGRGLHLFWND